MIVRARVAAIWVSSSGVGTSPNDRPTRSSKVSACAASFMILSWHAPPGGVPPQADRAQTDDERPEVQPPVPVPGDRAAGFRPRRRLVVPDRADHAAGH